MAKKLIKKVKYYSVDWYNSSGFCYRTTTNCTWNDVLECKRTAKMLGEKIKYEHTHTREYDYSY